MLTAEFPGNYTGSKGGMSLNFVILDGGNKKQHHNVYLCPQNLMAGCKPGLNAIQICTAGLSTPTETGKKGYVNGGPSVTELLRHTGSYAVPPTKRTDEA